MLRAPKAQKRKASDSDAGEVDGKVKLVLDTARSLFLEQGYDPTSMDEIARLAGVSKATVYAHFSSKEHLLLVLVQHLMKLRAPKPFVRPSNEPLDIELALRHIAMQYTSLFLTADALALHRLITAQGSRFPEIGHAFYEAGPKRLHRLISELLNEANAAGTLAIENVDLAAVQFLSLVRGDLPLKWALSLDPPSRRYIDDLVDGGLKVFMAAYRSPKT